MGRPHSALRPGRAGSRCTGAVQELGGGYATCGGRPELNVQGAKPFPGGLAPGGRTEEKPLEIENYFIYSGHEMNLLN